MTTVINLFGGSGCGKSTTAALLFARMKLMGCHVELVREYVKYWAWNDRKVKEYDQLYLLGKQSAYESMLYGKVDYIVTDSPILLAGMYQEYRSDGRDTYVGEAALEFMKQAQCSGVVYKNFILERNKPFDPRGRWETEDQARYLDLFIADYLSRDSLKGFNMDPVWIKGENSVRDYEILSYLPSCSVEVSKVEKTEP
jgi:ABC-type oligopeptide transport system ATPase subunit